MAESSKVTYRLKVTQNAWLEGSDNKYGVAAEYLIVAKHPEYPKKRTLIQFEDIPSECTHIREAKMYLCYAYSHKASWMSPEQVPFRTRTLQVHQVKETWTQSEVTSISRHSGMRWSQPYLALDGTDAVPYTQDTVVMLDSRPYHNYVEFDVTEAARNWKSGEPNYGLLVWATNESDEGRDVRFYSNEAAANHPFMLVHGDA